MTTRTRSATDPAPSRSAKAKSATKGRKASGSVAVRESKRGRSTALATIDSVSPAGKRSSAASKAYERRRQRAVAVLGDEGPAVLPKRVTALRARIPFVASIIALLSCGLALTLMLTTRAAEDSYQLSAARAENLRMAQERAALERDVQAADAAPDLAARARDLGMIPARDPARLIVAADGGVAVVGTPAPAEGGAVPLLNPPSQNGNRSSSSEVPVQRSGSQPAPTTTRATPQPSNSPQVQAQGEQLVPMTRPTESVPGQPQ